MKLALATATILMVCAGAACNSRTSIGSAEPDGGAGTGAAGTGAAGTGAAGTMATAGTMGTLLGTAGTFSTQGSSGTGGGCLPQKPESDLFLPPTALAYPNDSSPGALALGDLNGDGAEDIVIGGFDAGTAGTGGAQGTLEIALSTKTGFAPFVRYGGVAPFGVALGDLNGDKVPDVVSLSHLGPTTFFNSGSGVLGGPTSYSLYNYPFGFAVADLDRDGKSEMVMVPLMGNGAPQGGITVMRAVGSSFESRTYDPGFSPSAVVIGDVDGMAGPDVVLMGESVHVLTNDGTGNLSAAKTFSGAASSLADVDVDGKLDLVGYDGSSFVVHANLGGGSFALARKLSLDGDDAVFGDVDGDGKVDAVVSKTGRAALAIYLNDGKGAFSAPSYISCFTGRYALGDVNGDKALDLVLTTPTSVAVRLHRAP